MKIFFLCDYFVSPDAEWAESLYLLFLRVWGAEGILFNSYWIDYPDSFAF